MNYESITQLDPSGYWALVEAFFPNYNSSDLIAECNDLQKLIDNEYESGDSADRLLNKRYDGDTSHPKLISDFETLHFEVLRIACNNMMRDIRKKEIVIIDATLKEIPEGATVTCTGTHININGVTHTWNPVRKRYVRV